MRAVRFLILCLALGLGLSGASRAAPPAGDLLEELQYRVSLGVWQDVAKVQLRLTRVGPDRYRAEFAGAAQGVWKLLSRWLPERYETEMVLEGGQLKPLIFLEEFQCKGRHVRKEYRFNYARGVLEVWRGMDHREPVKNWQTPLKEPVYDPLTLMYNLRLGAFGPVKPGQTLKIAGVPNPEPREMILNIGQDTAQGRKVMFTLRSMNEGDLEGPFFIFCTPQGVPLQAWIKVLAFARLSGQLLNPGGVMQEGLIAAPELSLHNGAIRK